MKLKVEIRSFRGDFPNDLAKSNLSKDAPTSRVRRFAASEVPIGNGLTAADPFFGGTTDSVVRIFN
jgi:hypothetical protein